MSVCYLIVEVDGFCLICSWEVVMGDMTSDKILKEFFIPDYILVPGSKVEHVPLPPCPVIVFINSKSGGQLGGELLVTYRTVLNKNQVIHLLAHRSNSR